jgi:hypothetical protein
MEQISSKIKDLEDRISQLEDTKILKHANEKPKHPTVNAQEKVVKDNDKPYQQDEDVNSQIMHRKYLYATILYSVTRF